MVIFLLHSLTVHLRTEFNLFSRETCENFKFLCVETIQLTIINFQFTFFAFGVFSHQSGYRFQIILFLSTLERY